MNSVKGWFAEMQVCNMSRWEGSGGWVPCDHLFASLSVGIRWK